jgi:hypothetical protein
VDIGFEKRRARPRGDYRADNLEVIGIVDRNPDFYATLMTADTVVSGPSTVLLEAVGIARRVFLWDDEAGRFQYPEDIFERFTNATDLHDKLHSSADPRLAMPAEEDVWASDWRGRYEAFLARHSGP